MKMARIVGLISGRGGAILGQSSSRPMTQHILFAYAHIHFHGGGGARGGLVVVYVVICLLIAGLVKWWTDRD